MEIFPGELTSASSTRPKADLINTLVPYFKADLENNEFCMWVTSEPLESDGKTCSVSGFLKINIQLF